ncbi:VOC family protein [Bacillus sp. APMAM]|nr:VOC family protein [Bacillus sp. APMAM]RTZ56137.1 VOC family protein [Bacillus sp. SAJ1]
MLNKVCVLTVKVENLQKAIEFYTEVLDFKVYKHYGEKIATLVHDEIPIVLEEEGTNKSGEGQNVLLGILSEHIESDFNRLKSKGVKILFDEPKPCPPGRYIVIEDPSGNQIEILEFTN